MQNADSLYRKVSWARISSRAQKSADLWATLPGDAVTLLSSEKGSLKPLDHHMEASIQLGVCWS